MHACYSLLGQDSSWFLAGRFSSRKNTRNNHTHTHVFPGLGGDQELRQDQDVEHGHQNQQITWAIARDWAPVDAFFAPDAQVW